MKRLFILLLVVVLCAFNLTFLSACGGGKEEEPEYSKQFSYNETFHWKNQLNGNGRTEVAPHENDSGRCNVCNYYFDATNFLTFAKVKYDDNVCYAVYKYNGDKYGAYTNIEIPAYHREQGDESPLPVVAINSSLFSTSSNSRIATLKSIKLNEGLKLIGNAAFNGTLIKEIVLPNSVVGGFNTIGGVTFDEETGKQLTVGNFSYWPASGGLYNTFGGCESLERVVIGEGVKIIEGYCFSDCTNLKEVVLGPMVNTIKQRSFFQCKALEKIVIPASVVSIPETSVYPNDNIGRYQALTKVFEYTDEVYMEITKEQYRNLSIKKVERETTTGFPIDKNGRPVDLSVSGATFDYPGYGLVEGWCGVADMYFKGEWHYDENGKPMPNV